jgi:hypothetical protein
MLKALILILLFSGSLNAAEYLGFKYPLFYFLIDDSVLICIDEITRMNCSVKDLKHNISITITCIPTSEKDGYVKDCLTKPTI